MGNNNVENLLKNARTYSESKGFESRQSPGLLQPQFHFAFAASAGHHIADPIMFSEKLEPLYKFSVIPDVTLRMYDLDKIGISNRHLSFFEAIVFGYVGAEEQLPKKEACEEYFNIIKHFNLDPKKLLVTSFGYAKAEGKELNSSKEDIFHSTWKKLLGPEKVKKTRGRRNLFYSRVIGNPGGIGYELYYQLGKNFVEIGSQVNYMFKFTGGLKKTKNEAILQGFGLERLLMAIEDKEKISDTSLILPIKNVVKDYLKTYGEDETTINLYDENLFKIADNIRATSFIIHDSKGNVNKLSKSQRKILNGFKKNISSELNYLGIYDSDIHQDLMDLTIDLYKDRYPNLPQYKEKILEFIKP